MRGVLRFVALWGMAGVWACAQTPNGTAAQALPVKGTPLQVNADGTVAQPVPGTPGAVQKRVAVPSLHGMTVDEAGAELKRYSLVLGRVSGAAKAAVPLTIATQQPEAGTGVAVGTAVDVVLEAPPTVDGPKKPATELAKKFTVPNVVSMTLAEARSAFAAGGFGEMKASGPRNGKVTLQEPEAGSQVTRQTVMQVTLVNRIIPPPPPPPAWVWYAASGGLLAILLGTGWWLKRRPNLPLPPVVAAMVARPHLERVRVDMNDAPTLQWSVQFEDKSVSGSVSVHGEIQGERR